MGYSADPTAVLPPGGGVPVQIAFPGAPPGPVFVPIVPPLPSAAYTVTATQAGGPPGFPPIITVKTPGGFTFDDPAGPRPFDLLVVL